MKVVWPAIEDEPDGLGALIAGHLTHVYSDRAGVDYTEHAGKPLDFLDFFLRKRLPGAVFLDSLGIFIFCV